MVAVRALICRLFNALFPESISELDIHILLTGTASFRIGPTLSASPSGSAVSHHREVV